MDKYEETFQTWNKIASIYQDKFMHLDLYNDTYEIFSNLIIKGHPRILEIGCGPGNITKYLLNKRSDFRITAIDIAPNMIELAKKNNPTADFKILDCRAIDQLEIKCDAIIAGFCIPYLSRADCSKLINDSSKLMGDSGVIYLSFVEGNYRNSNFQSGSSGDRLFFYYHDLSRIKNDLESNDFKMEETISINYEKPDKSEEIHTVLIAKKRIQNKV
ncbi:Trans-aconitate 2-methyltransferase [Arenibacter antarcticus]|uniref:Class I SAM-dependent methyltransferase n=1 Tax=Arenibacter antarcticus TaxID=2040469 RepID=A0ABW5VGX9_9FLAO|nr:class I SAM-dependent methyltransferase [Arenibacter sp. H213]MCM4166153.1 class I SAM-dependent methyltransferase [Arenibacter sp. H213]